MDGDLSELSLLMFADDLTGRTLVVDCQSGFKKQFKEFGMLHSSNTNNSTFPILLSIN